MPIHGKPQNREGRQHRSPEDDADRVAGLFLAGRDAGELAHDELKVALCLGLLLTLRWRDFLRPYRELNRANREILARIRKSRARPRFGDSPW